MNSKKILKLVTAALMAALTCVATMILPINIPYGNGGYIHPGDAFVLMSGIILGPLYGGLAAGIGSMLADLFAGYPQYAFATLVIKLLAAVVGAYSYRFIRAKSVIVAGILGGIVVTVGYCLYDFILIGAFVPSLAGVPFNILQNIMGIVISAIVLPFLLKIPQIKEMAEN